MAQSFACVQGHTWQLEASPASETVGEIKCPVCGSVGETVVQGASDTFADDLPPPPSDAPKAAPATTLDPYKTAVGKTPSRAGIAIPKILGYEIVRPLGRGGMGVVYEARQIALNRTVAIKTILAAQADDRMLARFHREAEAVAQLNHPNIAQIHEVGDMGAVPFFAMEFVEGGSLADHLRRNSMSMTEVAELVKSLAEAIHFAHENHVIHRDLKPDNVLMTSEGTPKLTDFGLAKRMDHDTGQTRSGAVLGTPSYMAPEQAAGEIDKFGPQTDVYGLGAVLYELLTGRPPFRAQTPIETVRQVIDEEPVTVRVLESKVPRDLETICLKCLEKEPNRRYETAKQLAEELQRFLHHEPIQARPISAVQRTARWCRRKPVVAAMSLVSAASILIAACALIFGYVNAIRENKETRLAQQQAVASFLDSLDTISEFYVTLGSGEDWATSRRELSPLRKQLLAKAQTHYKRLTDREGYLSQLAAEGGSNDQALEKLGDAWNYYGRVSLELSNIKTAHGAFREAIKLRGKLADNQPAQVEHQRKLANSHMNLGVADVKQGEIDRAWIEFSDAQNARKQLLKDKPNVFVQRDLAMGFYNWGNLAFELERFDEAQNKVETAAKQFKLLADNDPHQPRHAYRLAACYRSLADIQEDLANAFDFYEKARLILNTLPDDHTQLTGQEPTEEEWIEYQAELAVILLNLGHLYREADDQEAAGQNLRRAEQILLELVDRAPSVVDYQRNLETVRKLLKSL